MTNTAKPLKYWREAARKLVATVSMRLYVMTWRKSVAPLQNWRDTRTRIEWAARRREKLKSLSRRYLSGASVLGAKVCRAVLAAARGGALLQREYLC